MAQQNMTLEMAVWIAKYGSERLQLLAENGYPIMRQYVTERVAMEYPRFTPDFEKKATWRELNEDDPLPTNEQINLARKYGGRAFYLTGNTNGYTFHHARIAVVIAENPFGVPLIEADKNY